MQSKNADANAIIPNIIDNITSAMLDSIIATSKVIEKNTNPTNVGHFTILLISIANIIVTNIIAKNISIFIFISFLSRNKSG